MNRLFCPLSLKGKLTLIISLTSCLVLLLSFVAFMFFERYSLRQALVEEIYVISHDISESCAAAIIFEDSDGISKVLNSLSIKPHIRQAVLLDSKDEILTSFAQGTDSELYSNSNFLDLPLLLGHRFTENSLESVISISYKGEFLGKLFLVSDLSQIDNALYSYAGIGVLGFIVYSLIAFLIASFLQRLISQPIEILAQSMVTVAKTKKYTQRLVSDRKDELGQLFDGFNSMLEEIEKRENDLKQNENHLDFMAHHDSLTGLANRLLLTARMEQSIARSKRMKSHLGILFIDLDRFKNINDSFGHDYGDQVLCMIADRLKGIIREADTVARLGGDEFIIVIEQVRKAEDLSRFIQKLMNDISAAITIGPHTFHVTATVGACLYPDHGSNVKRLLTNADLAMYEAKDDGRNSFQFYSPEMDQGGQTKVLMENRLRQALENDHFVLHYQPQYDMQSGGLVGFEALLRWDDPERGMIPPDQFIPLAEESGLIVPIGEWIIATACQTLKELQTKWPNPLRMAINISPRQFRSDALIPTVAKEIYHSQLNAEFLELEITESMVMNNVSDAISKMRELKQIGVHLAIDDFGTGYSSLGYLKQFPLSRLKIDRSFVRDLTENSSDHAIVNSIIALGKTLNFEIIAEGIETEEQYELLKKAQCNEAQGFLLSRPLAYGKVLLLLDSMLVDRPDLLI
jgi:diguanylate cyclase (GGDEF)-like protein